MKLNLKNIRKGFLKHLAEKLEQKKAKLAKKLLEAAGEEGAVPEKNDIKLSIVKSQPSPNMYRYQFNFSGKTYFVDFHPSKSLQQYDVSFYARTGKDSEIPSLRFGIGSPTVIEPLIARVLHCIKEFIKVKRPSEIRFVPGENTFFPDTYHTYMYSVLKTFEKDVQKIYAVQRVSGSDNVAFIMRKGSTQSNLKSRSWHPATHKPEHKKETEPVEEEIANVTGAGVACDVPFMSKEKLKKNLAK